MNNKFEILLNLIYKKQKTIDDVNMYEVIDDFLKIIQTEISIQVRSETFFMVSRLLEIKSRQYLFIEDEEDEQVTKLRFDLKKYEEIQKLSQEMKNKINSKNIFIYEKYEIINSDEKSLENIQVREEKLINIFQRLIETQNFKNEIIDERTKYDFNQRIDKMKIQIKNTFETNTYQPFLKITNYIKSINDFIFSFYIILDKIQKGVLIYKIQKDEIYLKRKT